MGVQRADRAREETSGTPSEFHTERKIVEAMACQPPAKTTGQHTEMHTVDGDGYPIGSLVVSAASRRRLVFAIPCVRSLSMLQTLVSATFFLAPRRKHNQQNGQGTSAAAGASMSCVPQGDLDGAGMTSLFCQRTVYGAQFTRIYFVTK